MRFKGITGISQLLLLTLLCSSTRADDKFADFEERVQIVARISNGLSLEKGLIDGTMPVDDVISELLQIGSVTPDDIEKFETQKVLDALDALEQLPDKLEDSDEVRDIEKQIGVLNEIRELSKEVKPIDSLQGIDGFFDELNKFESQVNFTDGMDSLIKSVLDDIEAGKNCTVADSVSDVMILQHVQPLQDLSIKLPQLETELGQLGVARDFLSTLDSKNGKAKFIESLSSVIPATALSFSSSQTAFQQYTDEDKEKAAAQLATIFGLIQPFLLSEGHLNNTKRLTKIQRRSTLEKTSAFFDNTKSLNALPDDLKDDWLKSAMSGSALSRLETVLSHFKDLQTSFLAVKSEMDTIRDNRSVPSIQNIIPTMMSFTALHKDNYNAANDFSALLLCPTKKANIVNADSIVNFHSLFDVFQIDIDNLNSILESLELKKWANLSTFTSVLKIDGSPTKLRQDIPKMVDLLKNSPEVSSLVSGLSQIRDGLTTILPKVSSVKQFSKTFANKKSTVESFKQKYEQSNLAKFFSCLNDDATHGVLTGEAVDALEVLRNMKNNKSQIAEVKRMVNSIEALKAKIQDLRKAGQGIKDGKSEETDMLKTFNDSEKTTQSLGQAAQGLAQISDIIHLKGSIDDIKKKQEEVEGAAKKYRSKLDQKSLKRVVSLNALVSSLLNTFLKADELRASSDAVNATKITDYGSLLKQAADIPEVDEDIGAMLRALEQLTEIANSTDKGYLLPVVSSVRRVKKVDWKLGKYKVHFTSAESSLANLDMVFSSFGSTDATVGPNPAESSGRSKGEKALDAAQGEQVMPTTADDGLVVTVASIGVPLIIALLLTGAYFWVAWKKTWCPFSKPVEENKPVVAPPDLGNSSVSTSSVSIDMGKGGKLAIMPLPQAAPSQRSVKPAASKEPTDREKEAAAAERIVRSLITEISSSGTKHTLTRILALINKAQHPSERDSNTDILRRDTNFGVQRETLVDLGDCSELQTKGFSKISANNFQWSVDQLNLLCILTERPILVGDLPNHPKHSTAEHFWHMIALKKPKYILVFDQLSPCYPDDKNRKSVQFGIYKVECVNRIFERMIGDKYTVDIYKNGKKVHSMDILHCELWMHCEHRQPRNIETTRVLLEYVHEVEESIVVQCELGMTFGAEFIAMKAGMDMMRKQGKEIGDVMQWMHSKRFGVLDDPKNVMTVILGLALRILQYDGAYETNRILYFQIRFYYIKIMDNAYDVETEWDSGNMQDEKRRRDQYAKQKDEECRNRAA